MFAPIVLQSGAELPPRASHFLAVYARLKPGVSFEQSRQDMDRIGQDLEQQYPTLSRGHGAHVVPLGEEVVKPVQRTLLVLMSAVGFILHHRVHQRDQPPAGARGGPPARDGRAIGDWRAAWTAGPPGARRMRPAGAGRWRRRRRDGAVGRAAARRADAAGGPAGCRDRLQRPDPVVHAWRLRDGGPGWPACCRRGTWCAKTRTIR